MDNLKEQWPKYAAISIAAIALGYMVYRGMSGNEALKEPAKALRIKGKDGKMWPAPRKIISESMS
jgi:hypothetical protein